MWGNTSAEDNSKSRSQHPKAIESNQARPPERHRTEKDSKEQSKVRSARPTTNLLLFLLWDGWVQHQGTGRRSNNQFFTRPRSNQAKFQRNSNGFDLIPNRSSDLLSPKTWRYRNSKRWNYQDLYSSQYCTRLRLQSCHSSKHTCPWRLVGRNSESFCWQQVQEREDWVQSSATSTLR